MSDLADPGPADKPGTIAKPIIEFRLLGAFGIRRDDLPYRRRIAGPARELLIFLLSHPDRGHRREALPEAIWGELRAPSRGSFNTTLWRLKKFLTLLDGPDLACDAERLRLVLSDNCTVDSGCLWTAAQDLQNAPDDLPEDLRTRLIDGTAAWRGPFAEGETSDWLLEERERMFDAHVRALMALMRDAALRADFETALTYCLSILRLDPFREHVHCDLLWFLVLTGQRARAIRCHLTFRAKLRKELDIAPMAETTALFDFLKQGIENLPCDRSLARRYADFVRGAALRRATVYPGLHAPSAKA